jgi:hypothetical protein
LRSEKGQSNRTTLYAYHQTAQLEEGGLLRVAGTLCIKDETCGEVEREHAGETIFDLTRIDPRTVRMREISRKGVPLSVWLDCDYGAECVQRTLAQYDDSLTTDHIMCASHGACTEMMRDLRGLIKFVDEAPDGRMAISGEKSKTLPLAKLSREAGRFKKLALELEELTRGERYGVRVIGGTIRTYKLHAFTLEKGGWFHRETDICEFGERGSCAQPKEKYARINHILLEHVSPELKLHEIIDRTEASKNRKLINWVEGPVIDIDCIEGEACVVTDDGPDSNIVQFALPCGDERRCDRAMMLLGGMIEIASSEKYSEITKEIDNQKTPATKIENRRDAVRAVKRVTNNLAPFDVNGENVGFGDKNYLFRNSKLSLGDDGRLEISFVYRTNTSGGSAYESNVGEVYVDLVEIVRDTIFPAAYVEEPGFSISLDCDLFLFECINGLVGKQPYDLSRWDLRCKDKATCDEIAADLRGLVDYSLEKPANSNSKEETSQTDETPNQSDDEAIISADLTGAMRRQVNAFHRATLNGEAYFGVTWGDATRLLRGGGASINGDGDMVVHRQACLALTPANFEPQDECKLETLFQDYDLAIDLGRLDQASVKIHQSSNDNDERGRWVKAACREGGACAKLVLTGGQAGSIMQSYGEIDNAPNLRFPCADRKSCDQAAKALRELVKRAPKPKREKRGKKKSSTGDLVGTWRLQQPNNPDWVVEYRADGTYLFTAPNFRVDGVYEAADGSFSTRATSIESEDSGSYRLIDNDTLEMNGNLGRSIWKKRR